MLKNISKLEVKINEKVYQFLCDMDSPLEHVKEALFQFSKYAGQLEDAIKAHQNKVSENPDAVKESLNKDPETSEVEKERV